MKSSRKLSTAKESAPNVGRFPAFVTEWKLRSDYPLRDQCAGVVMYTPLAGSKLLVGRQVDRRDSVSRVP